jgi:lactam utilization protein B
VLTMNNDTYVITLSKQERMKMEMIVIDADKDEALAFVRELRSRLEITIKGLKSHIDR